jgi:hypothetical protein
MQKSLSEYRTAIATITLLVSFILSGCTREQTPPTPPASKDAVPVIEAPVVQPSKSLLTQELVVEGLGLGSAVEEVVKNLGQPEKIEKAPQQQLEFYLYPTRGLELGISSDRRVHTLSVEAPFAGETARGLRVGNSVDQVTSLYGAFQKDPTYDLSDRVSLTVGITDNRVESIYLSWGYK